MIYSTAGVAECVVCGRNITYETNHQCTPAAIRRYEKRMQSIEQEPPEIRDALSEGLAMLDKHFKE